MPDWLKNDQLVTVQEEENMAKVVTNNIIEEKDDPLEWYTPNSALVGLYLSGPVQFQNIGFIVELVNSELSHHTTIGTGGPDFLLIEDFEPVLKKLGAEYRFLRVTILNHDPEDKEITVGFTFPGKDTQIYPYTIPGKDTLTIIYPVSLMKQ